MQHTHFQLFSKYGPFSEGRTIPASVAKLELTFIDAHLRSFTDHDDGVRAALADRPLTGGKTRNFITYDARTQCHHGGEATVEFKSKASS